ncbi:hypothetical protein [Paenibacillus sp. JJ-223]|uniref:hypothetical protein n=1 Tax=Paenibacillus sp. JJ-223 TaxID=2905647 RepID=UPI001F2E6F00|nr:hypothetical protein [Paenibacillus sp. JJ-223]CAH1198815.1 hypothetical protein PAECIP111890_01362 [Paenibacillus sp. JJ-223]
MDKISLILITFAWKEKYKMTGTEKRKGIILRRGGLLALSLLLMSLALLPAGSAQAADSKWINQIWDKYKAYNKKTVSNYNAYMKKATDTYKAYLQKQNSRLDELESIVLEDQKKWNEWLKEDLAKLTEKYGDNRELRDALNQYERDINPNSLSSPMGLYSRAANRNSLSSTMGIYDRAINENALTSYMAEYKKAVDPDSLTSPAFALKKTVSDRYLTSPMYLLMKNSSTDYLTSPLYRYSIGKISKSKAQQQYSKLYKDYTAQISRDTAAYKKEIAEKVASADLKIQKLYLETIQALEKQRNATLQNISDQRKKMGEEGLTWEPLLVIPAKK